MLLLNFNSRNHAICPIFWCKLRFYKECGHNTAYSPGAVSAFK